mmetsp:Transcript_24060/g.71420  ORF Transcript_24060/g.71420 Transcript_24060/m.71420 type:complete len:213 (+) Transcript_24060:1351-1989(+)
MQCVRTLPRKKQRAAAKGAVEGRRRADTGARLEPHHTAATQRDAGVGHVARRRRRHGDRRACHMHRSAQADGRADTSTAARERDGCCGSCDGPVCCNGPKSCRGGPGGGARQRGTPSWPGWRKGRCIGRRRRAPRSCAAGTPQPALAHGCRPARCHCWCGRIGCATRHSGGWSHCAGAPWRPSAAPTWRPGRVAGCGRRCAQGGGRAEAACS